MPQGIARIQFYPDGSSSGGRIIIGQGHQRRAVAIDVLTGRAMVSRVLE